MRHHNNVRTLNRSRSQRAALMRGLAIALIENGKIKTTEAKARELRPYIEKLLTTGKTDTVASRRRIASALGEPKAEVVAKLFTTAKNYAERAGGYTRIIKMGDTLAGRREAVIELV
jgi:large subunit ribosomal protein L17